MIKEMKVITYHFLYMFLILSAECDEIALNGFEIEMTATI
jgi:hypothetical protein